VEKQLQEYLQMVKKRTLDDYYKAEGIDRESVGTLNLP